MIWIIREVYPTLEITHLTLVYNIAQLQHVYKRRFVILLNLFLFNEIFSFSELNLRIWQQGKKMYEETGKRPVVYNNKCGQMCGVSIRSNLIVLIILILVLVLRKRGLFYFIKNNIFF